MGDNLYNRGEQLQLNCLSEGGPVLEYTWLFSGNIIPNANTSTLTINNVNTTHAGDYTCNVTNNAGYQSNTFTVYSKSITISYCVCVCVHVRECVYVCIRGAYNFIGDTWFMFVTQLLHTMWSSWEIICTIEENSYS